MHTSLQSALRSLRNLYLYPGPWLIILSVIVLLFALVFERNKAATAAAAFATITVTGTADGTLAALAGNGTCDLREAIQAANTNVAVGECSAGAVGLDTISFNLPGPSYTIDVVFGGLQVITQPVVIEGAPFAGSTERVELNGTSAGAGKDGLNVTAGGSTIRQLVINRFPANGIDFSVAGGNVVENCLIGTDVGGTLDLGNGGSGIALKSTNNRIGGTVASARNVISGNNPDGIAVLSANNLIQGNYIGTDKDGEADLGNTGDGIDLTSSAAANNTISGNVISGNGGVGVYSYSSASGTAVRGNLIGTDKDGVADLGNTTEGVRIQTGTNNIVGGTTPADRNVISGNNGNGIFITFTTTALVQGNYIGTDITGTVALGNSGDGIEIDRNNSTIGGTTGTTPGGNCTGACNLISGNGERGIYTDSNSGVIQGNYIGTDVTGNVDLGNTLDGINGFLFRGTIGGTTAAARNVISGNNSDGISLSGQPSLLLGATVQGNYIGMNVTGVNDLGNSKGGIQLGSWAYATLIGGTTPGAGNLISGNDEDGIDFTGDQNFVGNPANIVQGNLIGTDVTGTLDRGNTRDGIQADGNSIVIGGTTTTARNIISGNDRYGISSPSSGSNGANTFQGNYVGTDITGLAPLGNSASGIFMVAGSGTVIGGTATGAGNLIAANGGSGVSLAASSSISLNGLMIQGNYIGTDKDGLNDLGNTFNGIGVGADGVIIGGNTVAARNVISGNNQNGIEIANSAANTSIKGNYIGLNAAGTAPLGNSLNGVQGTQAGSVATDIGGTAAGEANIITGNGENGVQLRLGSRVSVRGNAIYGNTMLGLDLAPTLPGGTVTPNDALDGDSGPNRLQNFPVLDPITQPCSLTGTIPGESSSVNPAGQRPASPITIDFYANATCDATGNGEGEVYLGSVVVPLTSTTTAFSFSFTPVAGKPVITATATDANGNTSEFSACQTAPINQPPVITLASVSRNEGQPGGNSAIASITDANQLANTLSVTINGQAIAPSPTVTVNGVTISNLALSSAGALTADVVAACGATAALFTLTATDNCNVTTNATLTVTVVAAPAPIIQTQPANASVCIGGNAAFTVTATNVVSYQWRKNGTNLAGANTATLTLNSVTAAEAASYDVILTGLCNTMATSQPATLTVNLLPATPTITPSPAQVCASSTGNMASGPVGATTYAWTITNGTITSASNIQTITYTAGASGNVGLMLTVTSTGGCSASNSANVLINALHATPTISPSPTQVCASSTGNTANGPAGATSYAWTITNGTITSAANIQNITYTAGASGNVGLMLTVTNAAGCNVSNSANVPITALPTTANAGPDQTVCNTTATLAANTATSGTGAWTIISGAGGSVTTPSSPTSSFTGTAGTSYTLRWTISNAPCAGSTDEVAISLVANPTTANAGPDQTLCATTTTLAANTAATGTGAWTVVTGAGGSFVNAASPTTAFNGTAGTTYTLRWAISNTPCTASTDDVVISLVANPTTANAGTDQTLCATTTTLAASTATVGTGAWTVVTGAGGSFVNAASPTTAFNGTTGTSYTLRWTISSAPCTASTDDVVINLVANPTAANAGPDQTVCGTTMLAANTATVGTGVWTIISGAGGSVTTPSSPTSTFTGVAGTSYTLRWTISNAPCTASTDDVVINLAVNPTTAAAGPDQAVCGTTVTLAANTAVTGAGAWTVVIGVGGSFVNAASPTTGFTGTAGVSYTLRWTISNAPCTISTDDVVINLVANPTMANAGPDQKLSIATASATLAANTPSSGTGTWSILFGPSTSLAQFSNLTSPTATFTKAGGPGFYLLRWTTSNAPCTDSTDDVLITFADPPTITKAFSPATITMGGTSTVTLTLNNSVNPIGLVASFTDTLTNMAAVGGGIGGTCGTVSAITIPTNATALNFSGIALPASGSCVVTFPVRSTLVGVHANTTSGVTTDFTATVGAPSNTANLTVNHGATIAKAFSPTTIVAGGTSLVTLTLSNASAVGVVAALTDTLTNMTAVGGAIGGTCGAVSANVLPANATNLSFSGIVIPASGSCVVSFPVRSNVPGVHPNTTSGVTTDQSTVPGPVSNAAMLTVNAPTTTTIAKAFSPTTIVSGGTSTVTLTLSNTLSFGVLGSFTDALTNMAAVGGPIGTTCGRLANITLAASATNVSLSGIVIPGNGSCVVNFPVRSSVVGVHPNATSGITTDQSPLAGPPSNTANLTVTASLQPTLLASKVVRYDFDGDRKSDLARYRDELGAWEVEFSRDGKQHLIQLVEPNSKDQYVGVAADFDGDGVTDAAVWRKSDGRWIIKYSLSGELVKAQFGLSGDVPMAADYDGDGRADLAVWRKGDGWHIQRSSNLTEEALYLGQSGDVPVIGDFDGDGQTDISVFRANEGRWLLRDTASGMLSDVLFGKVGDVPMAADFDGDGKDDLLLWRNGTSYVRLGTDQTVEAVPWGSSQPGEAVVFGDYDGDGRAEPAGWRLGDGVWWIFNRAAKAFRRQP